MNKQSNSTTGRIFVVTIILTLCLLLLVLVSTVVAAAVSGASEEVAADVIEETQPVVEVTPSPELAPDTPYMELTIEEVVEEELIEEVEEEPDYVVYHVQPGDSFWFLADQFYNDGSLYTKIMEDNNITALYPGDVVNIYDPINRHIEDSIAMQDMDIPKKEESKPASVSYTAPAPVSGSSDGTRPDASTYKDPTKLDTSNMTYLGNWRITGYDPHCAHCCGKTNGITASGNQAVLGYSCGSNSLPLGTEIYIEGYGVYRVDDCGGSSTNLIDIACDSHDICYTMTGNANVYIIN